MAAYGVFAIRDPATGNWYDNLRERGYRVRYLDPALGSFRWVLLTVNNTRIRNPEHNPAVHAPDDPVYPKWTTPV